jgi:hypothetical protein
MGSGVIRKITNDSSANYCKMPDGTQILWNQIAFPNSGTQNITFSQPFSSAPRVVSSWSFGTGDNVAGDIPALKIYSTSASGFSVTIGGEVPSEMMGALLFSYIAIGRWK